MDTFNFLVSVLIMLIALQSGEQWIVLAVLAISIFTAKELSTAIAFIIAAVVLYLMVASGDSGDLWPLVIFGLLVMALIIGSKHQEQPAYDPLGVAGFGDPFGG